MQPPPNGNGILLCVYLALPSPVPHGEEGAGLPSSWAPELSVPTVTCRALTQLCPCLSPLSLSEVLDTINPSDRLPALRVSLQHGYPALPGHLS